jgi:hypothetical protein
MGVKQEFVAEWLVPSVSSLLKRYGGSEFTAILTLRISCPLSGDFSTYDENSC